MEDLGYETYQKILNQAVTELKNDEFASMYEDEIAKGRDVTGDEFVEDCAIESDLEMYLPDNYVPSDSERMLLYRELDSISDDDALRKYRLRLEDRFGPVPREGVEPDARGALAPAGQESGMREDNAAAGADAHAVRVQPHERVLQEPCFRQDT